eukprot:1150734-Pelagomonas_calceolata.AAC.1
MQASCAAGLTKWDQLSADKLLFLLAVRWNAQNWQRQASWLKAGYHTSASIRGDASHFRRIV